MQIYFSRSKTSRSITHRLQIADTVMTQFCKLGFFPLSTVLIKREQEEKKELVLPNEVELTLIKNYCKKTKLGKYKSSEYKNKFQLFEAK